MKPTFATNRLAIFHVKCEHHGGEFQISDTYLGFRHGDTGPRGAVVEIVLNGRDAGSRGEVLAIRSNDCDPGQILEVLCGIAQHLALNKPLRPASGLADADDLFSQHAAWLADTQAEQPDGPPESGSAPTGRLVGY